MQNQHKSKTNDPPKSAENFHEKFLRKQKRETYAVNDLENIDQTSLPSVFEDSKT